MGKVVGELLARIVIVPNQYWLVDFSMKGDLSCWNNQLGLLNIVTNNLHTTVEGVSIIHTLKGYLMCLKTELRLKAYESGNIGWKQGDGVEQREI